jgi:Amt family ammonium transporter
VAFTVAGASLLWVGWFGFNAGSALAADGVAVVAFVNTNTAAGAAALGWLLTEWLGRGKPTALGTATGAVAGLVAVTPAAGFVEPWAAIVIGLVAGFLCFQACALKTRLGYDDALDVVGVHGVGGTWGAVATGIFASTALSDGGLLTGNVAQFGEQVLAILVTYVFCGIGTWIIFSIANALVGLRVTDEDEEMGLDIALHSETAYTTTGTGSALGAGSAGTH